MVLVGVTVPHLIPQPLTPNHRWELPFIYPVFNVVMKICRYVERIGDFSLPPIFLYNIYDYKKYYPGEPVHIYSQSLII